MMRSMRATCGNENYIQQYKYYTMKEEKSMAENNF